jgi:hypothetical protein
MYDLHDAGQRWLIARLVAKNMRGPAKTPKLLSSRVVDKRFARQYITGSLLDSYVRSASPMVAASIPCSLPNWGCEAGETKGPPGAQKLK